MVKDTAFSVLEKYNYQVPHLAGQVINRYIKEIARRAGLTELVEIETTKGGTPCVIIFRDHM